MCVQSNYRSIYILHFDFCVCTAHPQCSSGSNSEHDQAKATTMTQTAPNEKKNSEHSHTYTPQISPTHMCCTNIYCSNLAISKDKSSYEIIDDGKLMANSPTLRKVILTEERALGDNKLQRVWLALVLVWFFFFRLLAQWLSYIQKNNWVFWSVFLFLCCLYMHVLKCSYCIYLVRIRIICGINFEI